MSGGWLPWRRLVWLWLPAATLCLAVIGTYIWQSSGSLGREALLREQVDDLERSLARLEKIQLDLETDRVGVASLDAALQHVYEGIFGSLDGRLVGILKAVEKATRGAGMLPASVSYRAHEDSQLKVTRLGISFAVEGRYEQVRQMLGAIQSSPQFLIIEAIAFRGEEQATTRDIRLSLKLATILSNADVKTLRLLEREGEPGGETDG